MATSTVERNDLLRKLALLAESADPESAHAEADRLIIKYIGDPAITRAYNKIDKWYA